MSRWEYLEGVVAETPTRVAVRELGKILVEELSAWPPTVDWTSDELRRRYAGLYAPGAALPLETAVTEAMKRVRWELSRDYEAIDYYERNHHLRHACPEERDRLACELIHLYVYEALLQLIERTENRVKRADLIEGLDRIEASLRAAWRA